MRTGGSDRNRWNNWFSSADTVNSCLPGAGLRVGDINARLLYFPCSSDMSTPSGLHLSARVDCWTCLQSPASGSASAGSWWGRHLLHWRRSWPSRCTSLWNLYSCKQRASLKIQMFTAEQKDYWWCGEGVGGRNSPDGNFFVLGLAWLGTALQWRLSDSWHRFIHQNLFVLHFFTWSNPSTPNQVSKSFAKTHTHKNK